LLLLVTSIQTSNLRDYNTKVALRYNF